MEDDDNNGYYFSNFNTISQVTRGMLYTLLIKNNNNNYNYNKMQLYNIRD